jgi:hypothetical protein
VTESYGQYALALTIGLSGQTIRVATRWLDISGVGYAPYLLSVSSADSSIGRRGALTVTIRDAPLSVTKGTHDNESTRGAKPSELFKLYRAHGASTQLTLLDRVTSSDSWNSSVIWMGQVIDYSLGPSGTMTIACASALPGLAADVPWRKLTGTEQLGNQPATTVPINFGDTNEPFRRLASTSYRYVQDAFFSGVRWLGCPSPYHGMVRRNVATEYPHEGKYTWYTNEYNPNSTGYVAPSYSADNHFWVDTPSGPGLIADAAIFTSTSYHDTIGGYLYVDNSDAWTTVPVRMNRILGAGTQYGDAHKLLDANMLTYCTMQQGDWARLAIEQPQILGRLSVLYEHGGTNVPASVRIAVVYASPNNETWQPSQIGIKLRKRNDAQTLVWQTYTTLLIERTSTVFLDVPKTVWADLLNDEPNPWITNWFIGDENGVEYMLGITCETGRVYIVGVVILLTCQLGRSLQVKKINLKQDWMDDYGPSGRAK